jgi:murein DD-endopeptidase MepM/ murein hydrolase activator NlpD
MAQAVELWQSTARGIRDATLGREQACQRFALSFSFIQSHYQGPPPSGRWRFPLDGYGSKDFSPSSFKPRGFDYYLGSRGGAIHPAVDIFVKDRLERGLDDHNDKPISVHAAFGGLVVAAEQDWSEGDDTRGGVCAYVLEPATGRLAYYAHLDSLVVDSGDLVKRGQVLGLLGRTGRNAVKKRSGTHLHFMWMVFDPRDGGFRCLDPRPALRRAGHRDFFD